MSEPPDFSAWLRDQRTASGLTVAEIAARAGVSTTTVKGALRGVPPGAKAVRELTTLFPADPISIEAWIAATHARHEMAARRSAAARGRRPVRPEVLAQLMGVGADPTKPVWSRWAAGRMVALALSRHELERRVDEPGFRILLGPLLAGTSVPARKTLERLSRVLGPVPLDVQEAAASARRRHALASQAKRKDRIRRLSKQKLVAQISRWFGGKLPRSIQHDLARLSFTKPVGTEGYAILMRAQALHMGGSIASDYAPAGPDPLGPQPRVALRRALIGLQRRGQRGGVEARVCEECGTLSLLPRVYARRPWRGRCGRCWSRFTTSAVGQQWAFEVRAAQQAGTPVPAAPTPRKSGPGPLSDAERAAAGLCVLLRRALGEGESDPTGEERRLARDADDLLRASSDARCQRLVAALDDLAGDPSHPYRAYADAERAVRLHRRERRAAGTRRGQPLLGDCGHPVSSPAARRCLPCYRQSQRPLRAAGRRVVEVMSAMRASHEPLVQAEIARRARVSIPTVRRIQVAERAGHPLV